MSAINGSRSVKSSESSREPRVSFMAMVSPLRLERRSQAPTRLWLSSIAILGQLVGQFLSVATKAAFELSGGFTAGAGNAAVFLDLGKAGGKICLVDSLQKQTGRLLCHAAPVNSPA